MTFSRRLYLSLLPRCQFSHFSRLGTPLSSPFRRTSLNSPLDVPLILNRSVSLLPRLSTMFMDFFLSWVGSSFTLLNSHQSSSLTSYRFLLDFPFRHRSITIRNVGTPVKTRNQVPLVNLQNLFHHCTNMNVKIYFYTCPDIGSSYLNFQFTM